MAKPEDILDPSSAAVLTAIAGALPSVAEFFRALQGGDPGAQRRVADILPERSASQEALDELREANRDGG